MTPPPFDLVSTPLARGTTLLAASAGTGKTYTIAGLVLRLLLEEGLLISQILVTTYTEAATAELRTRVRSLLREGLQVANGGFTEDATLRALVGKFDAATLNERLGAALGDFDEAAIFTIHGFCQRVLRDAAFESGLPFDAELITDEQTRWAEVAADFWRTEYYQGNQLLTALALHNELAPAKLARLLQDVGNHPGLTVLPPMDAATYQASKEQLGALWRELDECWAAEEGKLRALLLATEWACKGRKLTNGGGIAGRLEVLRHGFATCPGPAFLEALPLFAQDKLASVTRAKASTPAHCFFQLCEKVSPLLAAYPLAVRAHFIRWAQMELQQRKRAENVFSFNDLLTGLHAALNAPGGDRLATLLRGRYPAALIDEFQDTDPTQEAIFQQVFGGSQERLFLIGDPKQAIYGFRGADVFCYLRAAARVPASQRWTLHTNHRSEKPLVTAVNRVFNREAGSFVLEEIEFNDVAPAGLRDAEPLTVSGRQEPSLRVWHWDFAEPITMGLARDTLPTVCSAAIMRLLQSDARIAQKRVVPSDVAVLVATHYQGRLVQQALSALGLISVVLSHDNVFHSREAAELLIVLSALAQPGRGGLLRAALGTDLLGWTAAALEKLTTDEAGLEQKMAEFQVHHARWVEHSFMHAFRRLLCAENVRSRLLRWPDGERRLTNLLHLGDLLHAAATEQHLSAAGLLQWLTEQGREGYAAREDVELRLELDDSAVQIVTTHRSKGLEYPIVFFPFSFGGTGRNSSKAIIFHDDKNGGRFTLDLANGLESKAAAEREGLAEEVRLFYVALTRARHACHLVWGRFKGCEFSAASWLLHRPAGEQGKGVETLKNHMRGLPQAAWKDALETLQRGAEDAIRVEPLPEATTPPLRGSGSLSANVETPGGGPAQALAEPRKFAGTIRRDWRISSFSGLTKQREDGPRRSEVAEPGRDEEGANAVLSDLAAAETPLAGIHAFPAGRKAGTCLHEILQELDFAASEAEMSALVAVKLRAFGFDAAQWTPVVTHCLKATLTMELRPGLTLRSISAARRLIEVEFHFPVASLDAFRLHKVLPEATERVSFEQRRGLLKGYIDMVFEHEGRFFIVDWKSNRLGADFNAYTPESVAACMRQDHYELQYHLYTVALHRYLRLRLPGYSYERHFGGVFYLFLRGAMGQRGVHYARPAPELIDQLDAVFSSRP